MLNIDLFAKVQSTEEEERRGLSRVYSFKKKEEESQEEGRQRHVQMAPVQRRVNHTVYDGGVEYLFYIL